jgi:hypothetical protein
MREKLTYDPGDIVNVSWAYVCIPRCTALCSFRMNRCHCNITAAVAVVVVEVAIEVVEIIIVAKMRNKQEKK